MTWRGNWWVNSFAAALGAGTVIGLMDGPTSGAVAAGTTLAVSFPLRFLDDKRRRPERSEREDPR